MTSVHGGIINGRLASNSSLFTFSSLPIKWHLTKKKNFALTNIHVHVIEQTLKRKTLSIRIYLATLNNETSPGKILDCEKLFD